MAVIAVYADWDGLREPLRLGWLHANRTRAREVFEFEFDRKVLDLPSLVNPGLDPRLGLFEGRQRVVAAKSHLWIAKFPSVRDEHDVGAWELVVQTLARGCGLRVPESMARRFANPHHTFLVKRFDRTGAGRRLHFASAMTLTGRKDGDDASTGASYLELARVVIERGARPAVDLEELWSRIVFNVLVSNTDDHLRNHGFLMQPGKGWLLSEAYDMNPVPMSHGLALNISESDNACDLDLVRSVAPYFRVDAKAAARTVDRFARIVKQWPTIAGHLGIPARARDRMASAFRRAA